MGIAMTDTFDYEPQGVSGGADVIEEDPLPTPRRRPIQREWAVQRGVKFFVKRAIAVEHEFASHDRGRARSEREHIGEAARGIRADWLDTELVLPEGVTFRCELKAPGVRPESGGGQMKMINKLLSLGHPASWANSVTGYGEVALSAGVPLKANWRTIAQHADELVAADIRQQEVRRGTGAGAKKSKPPRQRLTARGRRFNSTYRSLLP